MAKKKKTLPPEPMPAPPDPPILQNLEYPDIPRVRPVTEFEEITVRQLSIGFAGNQQDMTLYPEDVMEADDHGNIKITFTTMNGGEFVAYAGHTQWHSLRYLPHRRRVGTLRPDPKEIQRAYDQRKKEEARIEIEKLQAALNAGQ